MSSVFQFFIEGGFFMLLLVFCSIAAVAVILLRVQALQRESVMPDQIRQAIMRLQPSDDESQVTELQRLVQDDPSALGKIASVALQHLRWPKSENVEAVQTQARHETVKLEQGLVVLEVVTGIAPLLGLLGTVSGLVKVFANLGGVENVTDPAQIASGIAMALNTTIAGLAIAIPSLIAYSYFAKKIEAMSVQMESLVADLLTKCYHRKELAAGVASARTTAELPVDPKAEPAAAKEEPSPRKAPPMRVAPPEQQSEPGMAPEAP